MILQTHTYILFHDSDDGPTPFYVGESSDPTARFKQHKRDAANPLNSKESYEYLRQHNITEFDMEIVDGKSERELVEELTIAGFKLYNSNAGISKTAKRQKVQSHFITANRDAESKLAIREAADRSGRRNRLHGQAQQLTKSEVTRQRILGTIPTADELQEFEWKECPPELMGMKIAKTAERAEYIRWSDYSIYIAYRKKDKHCVCVVKHPEKGELWANGMSWIENVKQRALELVVGRWSDTIDQWVVPYID